MDEEVEVTFIKVAGGCLDEYRGILPNPEDGGFIEVCPKK